MTYIGVDNGASGSCGVIYPDGYYTYCKISTKKVQDYTKKKQEVTRLDASEFMLFLRDISSKGSVRIFLERPFVSYQGYAMKTSLNAVRFFEAQLVVIDLLGLSYQIVDSKQWQRELLPSGVKGTPALKKASKDIGMRIFPNVEDIIEKQKDADGLLIAEWARRGQL